MSETLRQRRGDSVTRESKDGAQLVATTDDTTTLEESKEELRKKLKAMVEHISAGPPKGISNVAQRSKIALQADPYNMELIADLGTAYANDEQWERCSNVLLRGWKRASEIKNLDDRCAFLMTLVQASLSTGRYRQAAAVMADIEEPQDMGALKVLETLRCQVCCNNGDSSGGLKAFHKAIQGEDFDEVTSFWAICCPGLNKIGAAEIARNAVLAMTTSDADKKKIKFIEAVSGMKHQLKEEQMSHTEKPRDMPTEVKLAMVIFFLLIAGIIYGLYLLERTNLQRLKIKF